MGCQGLGRGRGVGKVLGLRHSSYLKHGELAVDTISRRQAFQLWELGEQPVPVFEEPVIRALYIQCADSLPTYLF